MKKKHLKTDYQNLKQVAKITMNIRRMCQNLEQFNNRVSFKIWQVFFTVRVI